MTFVSKKKALRTEMLFHRNQLSVSFKRDYDLKICQVIFDYILNKNCRVVHCYWPIESEIDLKPLIQWLLDANIMVICPVTMVNRKMENKVLKDIQSVEKGLYNTWHPTGNAVYHGEIDLIIVPGLAVDSTGNRLGYGGGYYDLFLKEKLTVDKIGAFYPFQKVENLPFESHDIPLDKVFILEE